MVAARASDTECGVVVMGYRLLIESAYESMGSDPVRCLRPYVTYSDWSRAAFMGAAENPSSSDDSDGDRRTNLQEYVEGTNPLRRDSGALSIHASQGRAVVVWMRRSGDIDVRVKLEQSTDLGNWSYYDEAMNGDPTEIVGLEQISVLLEETGSPEYVRLLFLNP